MSKNNDETAVPTLRFRDLDGLQTKLNEEAERLGLSGYSELIRRYCKEGLRKEDVDYQPFINLNESVVDSVQSINKVGVNLNQLIYLLHVHGFKPDDITLLCELLSETNALLLDSVSLSREVLNELRRI